MSAHMEMHVAHRVGMEIVIAREVVALSVAQGGAAKPSRSKAQLCRRVDGTRKILRSG